LSSNSQGYETIVESAVRNYLVGNGSCDRTRGFEEPPILILDEATSAVDNETEAAIQNHSNELLLIELRLRSLIAFPPSAMLIASM